MSEKRKYKKLGSYWKFALFFGIGIGGQEITLEGKPLIQIVIVMLPFCCYVEIMEVTE